MKLCLADAIHNFRWLQIMQILQKEVNYLKMLLIEVKFILQHVPKLLFNVIKKMNKNTNIIGTGG